MANIEAEQPKARANGTKRSDHIHPSANLQERSPPCGHNPQHIETIRLVIVLSAYNLTALFRMDMLSHRAYQTYLLSHGRIQEASSTTEKKQSLMKRMPS